MTDDKHNIIQNLHAALFPEEFDFKQDSISDANERRAGKNPMSNDYVRKHDDRRAELGLAPYDFRREGPLPDSFEWVKGQVFAGRLSELQQLVKKRREEDRQEDRQKDAEAEDFELLSSVIDAALEERRFVSPKIFPGSPEELAFVVIGLLPHRLSTASAERRVKLELATRFPSLEDDDRDRVLQAARDRWVEIYFPE